MLLKYPSLIVEAPKTNRLPNLLIEDGLISLEIPYC